MTRWQERGAALAAWGDARARGWAGALATPSALALAVLGLLVAHLLVHAGVFTGLPRDELESVFWGQGVGLGYDRQQPPLHNWLAQAVAALIGESGASYGLLRVATLGALFLVIWRATWRVAGGDALTAGLAVLGLLSSVMFGISVFLNLTHSLTLLLAVALLFWSLTACARPGAGRREMLILGAVLGLGCLAKYTFVLFAGAFLLAALAHPMLRWRLLSRDAVWALAVAAVVVLPHGVWLLMAERTVAADLPNLLQARAETPVGQAWSILRTGWLDPLAGVAPPLVLLALCVPGARPWRREDAAGAKNAASSDPWRRVLLLYVLFSLAAVTLVTLAFGGDRLRDHYLMPASLMLPVWAALRVRASRPTRVVWDRAAAALSVAAGAVAVGLLVAVLMVRPFTCERCLSDLPIPAWEMALREAGFAGGTLVARDLDAAAPLLLRFPGSRLVWRRADHRPSPDRATPGGDGCAVVLPARDPQADWPEARAWMAEHLGAAPPADAPRHQATAPLRGSWGRRTATLTFVVIAEGVGACH